MHTVVLLGICLLVSRYPAIAGVAPVLLPSFIVIVAALGAWIGAKTRRGRSQVVLRCVSVALLLGGTPVFALAVRDIVGFLVAPQYLEQLGVIHRLLLNLTPAYSLGDRLGMSLTLSRLSSHTTDYGLTLASVQVGILTVALYALIGSVAGALIAKRASSRGPDK